MSGRSDGAARAARANFGAWSVLWLLAVLIATRPYRGIFQDGHLYAAQALVRGGQDALARDIYFQFGNQDSFSLFTRAYAPAIELLGLGPATMLFWAAGVLLWFAGLLTLARTVFGDRRIVHVSVALALALFPGYGNMVLGYGESFVTPRLFAEGLGLFAIAWVLQGRRLWPGIAIVVAAALHPLMALCVFALCLWLAFAKPLWFVALGGAGLAVGGALGLAGIAPFSWIFEPVDPEWYGLVEHLNPIVLTHEWIAVAAVTWLALPLLSLLLIAARGSGRSRRLAVGVLVIGVGFTALSLLLADLVASRFFFGLQLWRGQFLLALGGNLLAYQAWTLLPEAGRARLFAAAAIGATGFAHVFNVLPVAGNLFAVAALVAFVAERRAGDRAGLVWQLGSSLPAAVAAVVFISYLGVSGPAMATYGTWESLVAFGVVAAAIIVLHAVANGRGSRAANLVAVAALVAALAVIDRRSEASAYAEGGAAIPAEVADMLRDRTVYWEGGLDLMWFKLNQPQFYACRQMAGIVFFRAQAFEFERRTEALGGLQTMDFEDGPEVKCTADPGNARPGPDSAEQLAAACSRLAELDILVLRKALPGVFAAQWTAPFESWREERDPATGKRSVIRQDSTPFHIYQCDDFRETAQE